MEIKNNRGAVIGKIQFHSQLNEDTVEKIISELQPGDGKAIYNADAVENNFTQQTNYAATNWDKDLASLKERLLPWQPLFPALSTIQMMQVYYGFENLLPHEIDEMIEESKRTGKNIVVRDLKPNIKLVGVKLTYLLDQVTFTFRIFGTTKSRVQVPDSVESKIEYIEVRGNEAFYVSSESNQQLIWIEEDATGKALQYELIGQDMSKEALLNIAASMI